METIADIRAALPATARDLSLNLQAVLETTSLNRDQTWMVAVACAITAGSPRLLSAVRAAAGAEVGNGVLEDASAAAGLMAMNNVFYRFRHFIGKDSYQTMPARLRMQRLAKVETNKADFELTCLAVSAINGCEACVKAHEQVVLHAGLSEAQVFDAVRIAATVRGVAVALGA